MRFIEFLHDLDIGGVVWINATWKSSAATVTPNYGNNQSFSGYCPWNGEGIHRKLQSDISLKLSSVWLSQWLGIDTHPQGTWMKFRLRPQRDALRVLALFTGVKTNTADHVTCPRGEIVWFATIVDTSLQDNGSFSRVFSFRWRTVLRWEMEIGAVCRLIKNRCSPMKRTFIYAESRYALRDFLIFLCNGAVMGRVLALRWRVQGRCASHTGARWNEKAYQIHIS